MTSTNLVVSELFDPVAGKRAVKVRKPFTPRTDDDLDDSDHIDHTDHTDHQQQTDHTDQLHKSIYLSSLITYAHPYVCGYLPPLTAFPRGFFAEACPRLACNHRLS